MDVRQRWNRQLKNSISGGGIMLPQIDPFNPSVFYVSDGLFSTYASMRFRKLSLATGQELATVLTRDAVRCMYCSETHIYAFLNKRILKLDRSALTVAGIYQEKIPRSTDYVGLGGADVFLMANWNAPSMSVLDVQTQRIRRKKIDGCCGIFLAGADMFLIFNYNSILEYSLQSNRLSKIADTEPYTKCVMGNSGRAYLLCVTYSPTLSSFDEYKILIYSFVPRPKIERIVSIPKEISVQRGNINFRLSKDEQWLYLFDDHFIWVYSLYEDRIIAWHTFPSALILTVFPENKNTLVLTFSNTQNENTASLWELKL